MFGDFQKTIGVRYRHCSLDNFELSLDADILKHQQGVLKDLRDYLERLPENVAAGRGLFLYGPVGGGKDHLLAAAMMFAFRDGFKTKWENGQGLYSHFRDAIKSDTPEWKLIRQFTAPRVLAISDPSPPEGPITSHQMNMLQQVVDGRYRDQRPTWWTLNVANKKDAEAKFGVALVDRMLDGALALPMAWPSFRKSVKRDEFRAGGQA